jgi:hypothetical protein
LRFVLVASISVVLHLLAFVFVSMSSFLQERPRRKTAPMVYVDIAPAKRAWQLPQAVQPSNAVRKENVRASPDAVPAKRVTARKSPAFASSSTASEPPEAARPPGDTAAPNGAASAPAPARLNLALPEDYRPSANFAASRLPARSAMSPSQALSRDIADAAIPDCLRPGASGGRGSGLLALPGLALDFVNGKCK